MVYGKVATSFRLMTEEVSIKWKVPVNSAVKTMSAGMVIYFDATLAYAKPFPTNTSTAGLLTGVIMDEYSASLDETQGSGLTTMVIGPHVGATSQFTTTSGVTAAIGHTICNPSASGTAGKMEAGTAGLITGNMFKLGNVLANDGVFLTYYWQGAVN